eukprot:CAMPEP_0182905552 /NCGR_PEP_ID=MMETSP0034_2-20130328/33034_1 /TAXON_ID=156128 /ORGANISM="Nephroselmis pyriformis, Strain CCMP717" /LENGTH=208 /DNA_ID=CAMNT_0025040993 /DNA_START=114 /DNA_END=736 /DNA_ORIENTATION=+
MTAAKTVIIRQDEIFQTAVARGELEKVKEMIAHGAVVNCKNQFHVTPLHLAAAEDLIDVMEVLLANGAAVDARALDSSTPLHHASREDCTAAAELLLKNGADARAVDSGGRTPFQLIYDEDESPALVRLLTEAGGGSAAFFKLAPPRHLRAREPPAPMRGLAPLTEEQKAERAKATEDHPMVRKTAHAVCVGLGAEGTLSEDAYKEIA